MKRLSIFFAALMACIVSFAQTTFEKVTAAPADWSGEYLIVYENSLTEAYVFNGVDAEADFTKEVIASNKISTTSAVSFKIAKNGNNYSILVQGGTNDGKYLGYIGSKNGLNAMDSTIANTITYDATNNTTLIKSGSVPSTLQFNNRTGSGNNRFRYYKSAGEKAIQLYKKVVDKNIPATAIALNQTSLDLEQYKYVKLVPTLTPAEATTEVVWTSSNEKVATVVNGVVSIVAAEGTATITATAGSVSATCEISAKAATILTCAEAAEKALSVSANNEVLAGGKYVIRGYVTEEAPTNANKDKGISADFEKYGNYSVWLADTRDGGKVFEAYQAKPVDGETVAKVGDYVEVVGDLTKFNTTPETVGGQNATIAFIEAPEAPKFAVMVEYNETMGAVTGAGKYEENATATLTATANEGYEFVNWTVGEETKTDNPLTITVTADMTITANFQKESEVTVTELFTYTTNQDWDGKTFESAKFRDVAVHNGIAYVLKNSEARIVALDAKTGLYIKDLDVMGVSGGAIALSAIQVLKDGTLLAINCQSNCKTGDVKVYKWANKDAAPEVLFAGKLDEALRIDAFYYEGTLENGAIWTSYSGGEKGTTCKAIKIPVVNGVAGEFVSYALNNYALETSSRVISANDTEISIATKGKMYTWTINADKTTTIKYYTEIGNKRYSNNVKLFEFDGTKYMATVYWGDKTGTIMNPQIIVYSYTALGRWSTTGLTELFTAPTDLGSGRNTSFFNGLDVVVGTKGFYVYMTSIAGGMTACYYGEPETPTDIEDTAIETIAPKAVKVLRNGQVYIIRDGKTYNMMGQIVE